MPSQAIMQNVSHRSVIATLRDAIDTWRKENGWSRETVCQNIVEAHERNHMDVVSSIVFEPKTTDAFQRQKVNADRIYRWLDDVSKDNNLLPANFMGSILHALPLPLRVSTVNAILLQVDMVARTSNIVPVACAPLQMLHDILKESAEAANSVAVLINSKCPQDLKVAHKEVTEAIEALKHAQSVIEFNMQVGELDGKEHS